MLKMPFDQLNSGLENEHDRLRTNYRVSAGDTHQLSYNQQSMWFLQNMDPQTTVYNVGITFHIESEMDAAYVQQALQLILNRHELFRAVYPAVNGTPVQVIRPQQAVAFEAVDATEWSGVDVEQAVNNYYHLPFDLQNDPVLRSRLYALGQTHFVLQVVMHHIAVDAWSIWLLVDELRQNIVALRTGGTYPKQIPLRYRYADFVQWQRDLFASERGQKMAEFWLRELAGQLPVLELPVKKFRSSDKQISYDRMRFVIEPELVQKVRDLAFGEGTSTYSLLLAVFQVLLSKYSGQRDVLVGTPMHGRSAARFAKLIGYFVNLTPMRAEVIPDDSFRAFLRKIGEKVQAVLLNQHYPFALLADRTRTNSKESAHQMIQVIFNLIKPPKKLKDIMPLWLDDTGSAQVELDGLVINRLDVEAGYGLNGIDLYMEIVDFKEQLVAKLAYNQTLFEPEMVTRMAAHFCQLLKNAVANPDQPISQLSMLTSAEREMLLYSWNDTAVPLPPNHFTHTLFAEQAERTPEATAVLFGEQSVTYQELNKRSNQLAHYLRSRGVGPDKCVGICMDRSLDMVIGLLGILKAGGAYLPLDPSYPKNRLASMLQDAQPLLVLSQAKIDPELFVLQDAQYTKLGDESYVFCLDAEWPQIANEPTENVISSSSLNNLAYVMYTSGSTGRPKGVAFPHRALTNLILWQLQHSQAAVGDRTLQFASLSFDVSCQEMFATWCSGGTLVLMDRTMQRDAAGLLHYITENAVNRLYLPFVALQQLANAANAHQIYPLSVREVITAGEQLKIDHAISEFFQAMPHCTLDNHYGPTETHVVTSYKFKGAVPDWPSIPPIGRPIANASIYILDKHLQPVPVGVTGELYIGGACLARGYLNNLQLTSERFVDNPFMSDSDSHVTRLYKTGDLARFLPDGNVEFLGRTDDQVKIRGFRIELGEIEAALGEHPNIQQTAVITHTDDFNQKQLIAYYVLQGETALTVDILRLFLQQKLPDYMIPSAFIPLEAMPLTSNGKIDRKSLPEPDITRPDLAQSYIGSRSPQEQILVEIWSSVLQLKRVGIHDNFFDLGGHSLLATQVISRIEKAIGISLPLRTIFEKPTIAGLSAALNQLSRPDAPPPPIVPISRDGEIPLSFAQERIWFLHQLAPNDHAYNIPVTLKYQQAVSRIALQIACDDLVVRHESLRTIFPVTDGVPRQEIRPPFSVTINEIDLSTIPAVDQETAVIQLVQADIKQPFDLASAPPWRFTLFQLNDESYVFYFAFHHIIFDHWSTVVLWQEFHNLYLATIQDDKLVLPALRIQYADYSVWQRNWLQGSVLAGLLGYWRGQLANLPVLDMPTDHPRPPVQSFTGATVFRNLSPTLSEKLIAFSRQAQLSPFMLMLGAFNVLLARYSGQTDIAIGVPVANRHYLAVEPIIGTFVNTLVVRIDLSGDPTFSKLLERVRDVLLDAYAHQELPFEKLVSEIIETRDISRPPLVQVLFNMTNAPFDYEQAAKSPISFMTFDRGAAQFDISVNVVMEEHLPLKPQLIVEYNTGLFEHVTIQQLLAHYELLLSAVVMDAQQPISSYDILAPEEQKRLIIEWNQTQMAYQSRCLHELFVEQVQRTAQKKAVSFQDQTMTYQELDEKSSQLARYLQDLGVGPEAIVGVFVERSLEMVIALLGILKAGGAYLPLDPDLPADRLAYMVEDAEVELILTQSDLLDIIPAAGVAHPLNLVAAWSLIEQLSSEPLPQTAGPENLAYVIYTSGSTGKPKGVQIEHRNVVNFITAMQQQPGISPDDILLSVTTLSFDISILEIFLPLLSGAQLVIADRLTAADGQQLSKAVNQTQATILQATPTTWSMLIEAGWQYTPTLRKALCGGEALSFELAQAILERNAELWNMYGPTENTIWSSVKRIEPGYFPITIGRPIGNTTFYVLDPARRPAPIGVAGELYIGGNGVARGYLNRPELTDDRFLPDPYTSWSNSGRMYRTGDLVRYLADGNVEYLGRIDFQVKIHGHRIELGEVEAVLSTHQQVREVVVSVHSNQNDQFLAAYIVPEDNEHHPSTTALRDFLRTKIPDYMIPSSFVILEEFPLTHNRKIDRKGLPAPDSIRPELENRFIGPRNDLETVLAGILADLLGLETVGIIDDFFELGGHSLQAARYVAHVGKALRTEVLLWSFLRSPNVADFAAYLTELPEGARIKRIAQLRVKMAAMSPEEVQNLLQLESHSEMDE